MLCRENHLIPGARDFMEALVMSGAPFIFLTNNSAPTPEDLPVRLGWAIRAFPVGRAGTSTLPP